MFLGLRLGGSGAFDANEVGSIRVSWTIESTPEGNRLLLHWQEKDGPPRHAPLTERVRLAGA